MNINIELLKWQSEIFQTLDQHRYFVLSVGRQAGKTFLCVFLCLIKALKSNQIVWWVAPTYQNSKIAFRRLKTLLTKNNIPFKANISELRIELQFNNSVIEFKSADKEEGLRGETVNFMVIDEMGLIKRDAWEFALRGTITVTKAQVIFIGTPKGKNLFYDLFCKGQDNKQTEYKSYQLESRVSNFFGQAEWEEVKKLPQRVFQQEYQAMFIDDGGDVFRNVRQCIKGDLEKPHPNKQYFAGIDLAKSHDYSVICIFDNYGHLVAFDRFNDISWTLQKGRIVNLIEKYGAYAKIDSTGLGDPILDDLQQHISCDGYKFSNTSKRQLIESLSMAIEKEEISFPEIPELINELNIFSFEQTEGGLIKYSAPEGMHDDIVMALALAYNASGGQKLLTDVILSTDGREEYAW